MRGPFRLELLGASHLRAGFDCGVGALNAYLQTQASQDARRRMSACYVALAAADPVAVAGYYSLAAASVPLADLPEPLAKRLPRYPAVPVARLGRLAIDLRCQGQGLGAVLLADAALGAARSEVAVMGLVVDAENDAAEAFYRHHGFVHFGANPRQLVVALNIFQQPSLGSPQ